MRSILHLTFTLLITLFAAYQTYQLQQVNKADTAIIEVKPQTDFHFAAMQPECNSTTAIGVDRMNVFLVGLENPITIAMTNVPSESLEVGIDDGMIIPFGDGKFNVRTTKIGKVTISVRGKNRAGEVCSYRQDFRVKSLPIVCRLGNKSGGKMGIGEFRAQRGLLAYVTGMDIDARMRVVGYNIALIRVGADNQSVYNNGPSFDAQASQLIGQVQIGDKYYFSDIKIRDFDGSIRDMEDMLFEIQ
ncbi:MAG: GldM family protein [Chitinophagales bacterium]